MSQLVISGIGPDKSGIVAALTDVLARHNCNIDDTSMTILGPMFAMILLVHAPDTVTVKNLQNDLAPVEQALGLRLFVSEMAEHTTADTEKLATHPYIVSVSGPDRTGIIQAMTQTLAEYEVNITDLNAQQIPGDNGPVYILMIETQIPDNLAISKLKSALQTRADALGVEVRLHLIEEALSL